MVRFIHIFLSFSIFIRFNQSIHSFEWENEQALKFNKDLLSAKLGDISTSLKIECENVACSARIEDLSMPNNALLTAIYKYGRLVNVKTEVKALFDLYRSTNTFVANKDLKQFQSDRRAIGIKVRFIINRSAEIVKLYEKYIKIAVKYTKILKKIEDPCSEKSPIKWKDLNIEYRVELIKLVHDRLTTCTDLLVYCNDYQELALNALIPMIDIFKELKNVNNMNHFVDKMSKILKNQAVNVTERYIRHNLNILSEEFANINSYIYIKVEKHISKKESFEADIRKWKEKAYQGEVAEDSDSSIESTADKNKDTKFSIMLKRMADHSSEAGSEPKKIKIDTEKIDNAYINQISECVLVEHGSKFGFDNQIDSIFDLDKIKQDLIAGKLEYDLMQKVLQNTKDAYVKLNSRFPDKWKYYTADALNIGNEIYNIGVKVNGISSVYANAIGLASSILKELKDIVNEQDPNMKWENVDFDRKREMLTFGKNGLIACTKLLEFCNDVKQKIWHCLNEIKSSLDNQELEQIFANWKWAKRERIEKLRQLKLVIDKLAGKKRVKVLLEDKYTECRREFNKYFYDWYIFDWKNLAYPRVEAHDSEYYSEQLLNPELKAETKTDEEIIEGYKNEIENSKLHEISYDLQMDYLLVIDTGSGGDRTETIKYLDVVEEVLVKSIFHYGEILNVKKEVERLGSNYKRKYRKVIDLRRFQDVRRSIGAGITNVISRTNELIRVYKSIFEFALNDVMKLSKVVADVDISWVNVHVEHKIELIQEFNDRLMPCIDLLKYCNKLEGISINALTEMRATFEELKDVSTFENFVNKLDIMANKVRGKPSRDLNIFISRQRLNEIMETNSFEQIIINWRNKMYTGELERTSFEKTSFTPHDEYQSEHREVTDVDLRVFEFLNENDDIHSIPDLDTPKQDLLVAIVEYESLLEDQAEARNAFVELPIEIPKQWKSDQYKNLRTSVGVRLRSFNSKLKIFAKVYADVLGFATIIIKELRGVVHEKDTIPWENVNLDHKIELLEMVNIRLLACTRLLGHCNDIKQNISPVFSETKNIVNRSNSQHQLLIKNLEDLQKKLNQKMVQIKPVLFKLSHDIVVELLPRTEDEYGRYEFNKWFHSWRKDISSWKLHTYHEIAKEDISQYYNGRSPTPMDKDVEELRIKDYKSEIKKTNLHQISTDIYEYINPTSI